MTEEVPIKSAAPLRTRWSAIARILAFAALLIVSLFIPFLFFKIVSPALNQFGEARGSLPFLLHYLRWMSWMDCLIPFALIAYAAFCIRKRFWPGWGTLSFILVFQVLISGAYLKWAVPHRHLSMPRFVSMGLVEFDPQELRDAYVQKLIFDAAGVSDGSRRCLTWVANGPLMERGRLGWGVSNAEMETIREVEDWYVRVREQGHTKNWLASAIRQRQVSLSEKDPYKKAIISEDKFFPLDKLTYVTNGYHYRVAGEPNSLVSVYNPIPGKDIYVTNGYRIDPRAPLRWAKYLAIDGPIAWQYEMSINEDGSANGPVSFQRYDAIEEDSRFSRVIEAVEESIDAKMKRSGDYGRFGSVHTYWDLKKRALSARGIHWRSPKELNPNTCFD